jgi:hypothetical protein
MTTPVRPRRGKIQARVMRVLNVPMRAILSLPFRTPVGGRLMLVRYVGRKTGTHYRQPVSYVRDGDVLLTPGGGRWTLSLANGDAVSARLAGRDVQLRPELVREPDEVQRLLDVMAQHNPAIKRFVPLPRTADGRIVPEALRGALDHGFCIVRWHGLPEPSATTPESRPAAD